MTLPRLIRKPQVDELVGLESMTAECCQGDPRGQAVPKRQKDWRQLSMEERELKQGDRRQPIGKSCEGVVGT